MNENKKRRRRNTNRGAKRFAKERIGVAERHTEGKPGTDFRGLEQGAQDAGQYGAAHSTSSLGRRRAYRFKGSGEGHGGERPTNALATIETLVHLVGSFGVGRPKATRSHRRDQKAIDARGALHLGSVDRHRHAAHQEDEPTLGSHQCIEPVCRHKALYKGVPMGVGRMRWRHATLVVVVVTNLLVILIVAVIGAIVTFLCVAVGRVAQAGIVPAILAFTIGVGSVEWIYYKTMADAAIVGSTGEIAIIRRSPERPARSAVQGGSAVAGASGLVRA